MRALKLLAIGAGLLMPVTGHAQSYGFATYTARIDGSGVIIHSNGLKAATRLSTGSYELTFTRDVSTCVAVATVWGSTVGYTHIVYRAKLVGVLDVNVYSTVGTLADRGINVIVSCGA